jgi:flagellar protein FlbT
MSSLVLELRPGETMIVNGASIRFRTKSRIELTVKARFLFGKQIMTAEEADTPARRIYFALQAAYVGPEEERARNLETAWSLIAGFKQTSPRAAAHEMLDRALALAREDNCYQALKLARTVIREEEAQPGPRHPAMLAYHSGAEAVFGA